MHKLINMNKKTKRMIVEVEEEKFFKLKTIITSKKSTMKEVLKKFIDKYIKENE